MKATLDEILSILPPQLSRRKTAWGLQQSWREARDEMCSPRTLGEMPSYIDNIASAMWNIEPSHMVEAVRNRDPSFFVSILVRIEQLDEAAKDAGKSIADRAALIRGKHIVLGFQRMAERLLREAGGTWPPGEPPQAPRQEPEDGGGRVQNP